MSLGSLCSSITQNSQNAMAVQSPGGTTRLRLTVVDEIVIVFYIFLDGCEQVGVH